MIRFQFSKIALLSLPILDMAIIPALARSTPIAQSVNCNNPQTTLEMRICATKEFEKADKELNQVYKTLKPKLSATQQKTLTQAQTTWIKLRDQTCAFEAGYFEGGTLEPVIKLNCLKGITEQRTKDLQKYLQWLNSR